MNKRYTAIEQRPLCMGDNNTCQNLAGLKQRRGDGTWRYHTLCDRHRRPGHEAEAFRNPKSKRYIPLNKCMMCNEKAEERHRLEKNKGYLPENILTLCKGCHRKIHRLLKVGISV